MEVNGQVAVEGWEAIPGSTELQEIPGLAGLEGSNFEIIGVMEEGEYLAILEVGGTCEIWLILPRGVLPRSPLLLAYAGICETCQSYITTNRVVALMRSTRNSESPFVSVVGD